MSKKNSSNPVKPTEKNRTLNPPSAAIPHGAPFNEQDTKRRLGNFSSAGEHSRRGGRTTGIVGQRKQKLHTDRKKK